MGTTIDSLQIEIQTSSSGASVGIDSLAASLERLKKVGSFNVVVKNLNNLSSALDKLKNSSSGLSKLNALASSIESLKKAGSFGSIGNSFVKLGTALKDLESMNIDGVVAKIKELNDKLGPVSQKLVAIGNAFKIVNIKSVQASGNFSMFGGKVNVTTLNLQSMISVAKSVVSALKPIINLLKKTIGEAIEWDGIAQRFGRGFGDQAEEVYSWIQKLNKEMGINVQQFMQYSSTYATMLKGFGVAEQDASKMALGYMELTYDIWAGYNDIYKSVEDAALAIRSAIAGEVEPIRKAGFTITEATLKQTAANHGLKISLENATEAQKSYLRYLAITDQAKAQGLVGTYAKELGTAEGQVRTFTQQLKSLAQTFGSIFLPVLVKVMPWLQAFIDLISDAIMAVANFFGIEIQKVDFSNMGAGAKGANKEIKKTEQSLKDLKNATTGIDELNIISPQSGGGSGGGGDSDWKAPDLDSLWNESIFKQIQFEVDEIKKQLEEALSGIEAVISTFALAIGTILVLCGNPKTLPLGIGLMAAGAVGLAHSVAVNWDGMSEQLAKTLGFVTSVLSGFLLALGAILAFSGVKVGLGVALLAAGAVSLATAASINWKFLESDLGGAITVLTEIVSGGLLAVGALLAFSGVKVGLGIALMAAGAVGLATSVGLNWDSMSEPVRKAVGALEAIVGGGLLAFGVLLALSGVNIPLGIGMIAAGAASLVGAAALNWGFLTGDMKKSVATLGTIVGGAFLGIGAVLAFTGVALPIGIAMMAIGAASIVATAPINWKSVTNAIKGVVKEIGIAIGGSLLALGALLAFTGVALPVGIALMAAGAASLIGGVVLNWDTIVNGIKKVIKEIGIIAGTAMLALGVLLVCTGVGIPLGIGLIAAGAAGIVAGVALNWDSIKTAIQNAINGVINWVKTYGLLALGVILCLTGAGIPMGIGLIKKGLGTETENGSTVGNDLLKTIKTKWEEVKNWWNSKPGLAKYTPVIGSIKGTLETAWNAAKKWWDKNAKLSIPSLSLKVTYTTKGLNVIQKAVVNALGLSGWPKLSFAANGGIFDMGSLVWAGEAGPEIVANAGGGKTGVMNVQQMSEAVYEGVYSAVVAAMRAGGGNGGAQSVNVYLDGKQITGAVEQRQKERGASLMGHQVYSY